MPSKKPTRNGDGAAPKADTFIACVPKKLPPHLLIPAAIEAIKINSRNRVRPETVVMITALTGEPPTREHIAGIVSKLWSSSGANLTVSFMDGPSAAVRAKILSHMQAWGTRANVVFRETAGGGQVRIARTRGDGYWSYLGTDILQIPASQPTMNLEGFTESTPEAEYKRVVRHETGHTLGFPHEHMRKQIVARIDPAKAYRWFLETYGWDKATVDAQVLTALDDRIIVATPEADQVSIMCYQLPGSITRDGKPIVGGTDIDENDYVFAEARYPLPTPPPPPPPPPPGDVTITVPQAGTYRLVP